MNVTVELPKLPKDYEYTGEYRTVDYGDLYLNSNNNVSIRTEKSPTKLRFFVVRSLYLCPLNKKPVDINGVLDKVMLEYSKQDSRIN